MIEEWKDVSGYEGYYQVSDTGHVRSVDRVVVDKNGVAMQFTGRVLRPGPNKKGYLMVVLNRDNKGHTRPVHRLVAETFIPNPETKPEVNHINGIKTDNRVENLEWCSSSNNQAHAYYLGLRRSMKGVKNSAAKLTEQDVIEIRKLRKSGLSRSAIQKRFPNVTIASIKNIYLNRTWKHIASMN